MTKEIKDRPITFKVSKETYKKMEEKRIKFHFDSVSSLLRYLINKFIK